MRCNIVFHPTTMAMSSSCNLLFVKRWCQDVTCSAYMGQPGIRPPERTGMTLRNQTSMVSIDLLLIMEETPPLPRCLTTHPQDNMSQTRGTEDVLVEHFALGHVFIITGLEAVMHQNTKHVLWAGLLTDDRGKVVEWLQRHLIYWLLTATVMRNNSVLTPIHLPFHFPSILTFPSLYLCLRRTPHFSAVCHSFKT